MTITALPLTPGRWPDLEALFAARGCAQARGCWCMYYREEKGGEAAARADGAVTDGRALRERRREALRALAGGALPPGLVGYEAGRPVGWVTLGPREDFPRLARSPVMRAVDDRPTWSVVCFVVAPAARGRGVATALLQAAIGWARDHGARLLEAYPVDREGRPDDDTMWFGAATMYRRAGFVEVARRKPHRSVVRLELEAVAASGVNPSTRIDESAS